MIVKGHNPGYLSRPLVMVTMTVDEALQIGMGIMEAYPAPDLGFKDGAEIFNAAWDLLPEDAPERIELQRQEGWTK